MYIVKNHFLMKTYSEAVISNTVYHKFPAFIVMTGASPNKISYSENRVYQRKNYCNVIKSIFLKVPKDLGARLTLICNALG